MKSRSNTPVKIYLNNIMPEFYNKADYTFDGKYFENIESIGAFPPIINLKNAIKQENEDERKRCNKILKNKHPQLFAFMLKHKESFHEFCNRDNNALLTLNM